MKKILIVFFTFIATQCFANNFHPVQAADKALNFNGVTNNVHHGDTIYIDASQGAKGKWSFTNVYGVPGDSVVFMNYGGIAYFTANNTGDNGLRFTNCRYFKVCSAGGIHTIGFYVEGTLSGYMHGVACEITGRSMAFDISGIFATHKASLFWVKQEQSCLDSLSFPNFLIDSFHLHHCTGRNLLLEGAYVGSTGAQDSLKYLNGHYNGGRIVICNGDTMDVTEKQQFRLGYFEADSLYIDSTGRGNFQESLTEKGAKIHDNIFLHAGFEFNNAQGNNISIGNGSRNIEVYNNITDGAYTNPIQIFGNGFVYVHNNHFGSAGNLYGHIPAGGPVSGALIDSRNYAPVQPGLGGSYLFKIKMKDNTWGTNTSGHDMDIQDLRHHWDTGNLICNSGTFVIANTINYSTDCSVAVDTFPPPDPAAIPSSGTYFQTVTVALNDDDTTATILYTLDGSNPRTSGIVYDTPFVIASNTAVIKTLKYVAQNDNGYSATKTETYNITATHTIIAVVLNSENGKQTTVTCSIVSAIMVHGSPYSTVTITKANGEFKNYKGKFSSVIVYYNDGSNEVL